MRCIMLILMFFSLADASAEATDKNCLTLVYDGRLGSSQPYFQRFYDALYARLGMCQKAISMTSNRKEQLLRNGEVDGDWIRVEGFAEQYPDSMIAVPFPIFEMPAHFFWLSDTEFNGKAEGLAGRRVGHPRGYRWLEWNLPKHGGIIVPLDHENTVWDLLTRGRLDVYVTSNMSAASLRAQANNAGLSYRHAIWQYIPFHHLLHVKHADLIPMINATLEDMALSGDLKTLLKVPGIRIPPVTR